MGEEGIRVRHHHEFIGPIKEQLNNWDRGLITTENLHLTLQPGLLNDGHLLIGLLLLFGNLLDSLPFVLKCNDRNAHLHTIIMYDEGK